MTLVAWPRYISPFPLDPSFHSNMINLPVAILKNEILGLFFEVLALPELETFFLELHLFTQGPCFTVFPLLQHNLWFFLFNHLFKSSLSFNAIYNPICCAHVFMCLNL